MILETERTYLREFLPEDAGELYHLNLDPEVLEHTGDDPFKSISEAEEFLQSYNPYQKHGMGRWAVIRKEDNAFLGWCGLKYSPDSDEYDIGFRFNKEYWGNGYASETAAACLSYGFNNFNIPIIIGRAMKVNLRSINVLEKIGMKYLRDFDFEGNNGVIYELSRMDMTFRA